MSTTVTITRKDLTELQDALGKAAVSNITELDLVIAKSNTVQSGGEFETEAEAIRATKDRIAKFQYAAGKNYNRARAEAQRTYDRQMAMQSEYEDPELEAYDKQRIAACESHCVRDEHGQPVMRQDDNGTSAYKIQPALKEDFDGLLNDLKGEYADAIKRRNDFDDDISAVLDEEVDMEFHVVPWDHKPAMFSGSYADILAPMFTGKPDFEE